MGALGGLLGTSGGVNGTGIQGPSGAAIVNPTNQAQIAGAYTGAQNGLQSQQDLLSAIQAQQGLTNQSNVYNQLQGIAAGTGPNPAQAMLNQNTGTNVANQAALMAGQRGAGANVGLMARQAAQQGAATQQQAVGQGATMQANQSLNAINSAGAMANNQANNQIGQVNANSAAQQAEQAALMNAQAGVNANQVASQGSVNAANAGLANTTMQGQHGLVGGILNGAGAAMGLAGGGDVAEQSAFSPQSKFGQFLVNSPMPMPGQAVQPQFSSDPEAQDLQNGMSSAAKGMFSKSSASAPAAKSMAGGMNASEMSAMPVMAASRGGLAPDYRSGGAVAAGSAKQKAKAPGDNYANDKIPAVLSEHEIVIPRSVTMGKDPINDSARFVASVLAKRRGKT